MPFMTNGKRDYKKEKRWERTKATDRDEDRAARMRNRRAMEKAGKVSKHDGKHVDHKKALTSGGSNSKSTLRGTSAKANLSKEAQRKKRGKS